MSDLSASWIGLFLCAVVFSAWAWHRYRGVRADQSVTASADAPWFELLSGLGRAANHFASRTEALEAWGQLLRTELGASALRLFRVQHIESDWVSLQAWKPEGSLTMTHIARVKLGEKPLGKAIQCNSVAGDSEQGFAMAWPGFALQFQNVSLALSDERVTQLLTVAHDMVTACTRFSSHAQSESATPPLAGEPAALSQQLVESLPVSMFVFEPHDLRLMAINQEAELEFGLHRSRVVGCSLDEVFGPAASKVAAPRMREALENPGPAVECDYTWSSPLGPKTLQVRHRALQGGRGHPLLLMVIARDVTAQRETQRALREATDRFLEFSESLLEDSLFISNPERDIFYFLAGSTYELWGISREHAEKGDFFTHILDEDRHLLAARAECERSLRPADFVFRVQHPTKGLTFIRTRTRTNVMPDGKLRVYGVVSDVTKERTREDQLLAARDAAESASLAKSQFMANMSHEFRTPMNGILGMSELLLQSDLSQRQRQFVQAVYQSGDSLLGTLDDILDFATLDAGKLELAPVDFVLRDVIEDTLELLAPRAHKKGLELILREGKGTPEVVRGDPQRLRQILLKFVANGIKFTHKGEVIIDVRPLCGSECPGWLEFLVSDTGPGMDAEVLGRLFTPFTQAQAGMSRQHEGVGLGLATAKRMIELMGGTFHVESNPGAGSLFQFALPFETLPESPPRQSTQLAPWDAVASHKPHVLVIEGHATTRVVLEDLLNNQGIEAQSCANSASALSLLQEALASPKPFEAAFIDVQTPGADGIALGHMLRQDPRFDNLKLILMFASVSAHDVHRAQAAGFQGFLAKPVRQVEVQQLIASICSGHIEVLISAPVLKGRVLVVEDNVVNQEVICQMLRKLDLDVQLASSALQGLRALCEHTFDLVLMDIMMPGMDGIEALQCVRQGADERFDFVCSRQIPVVAVTANALDGDEARFLAMGFDGYLSKPLRQSQLVQMLSKHLAVKTHLQPPVGPVNMEFSSDSECQLDKEALSRLKELDLQGNNQLLKRVITAFQSSADRLVPQLIQAQQSGDIKCVGQVAHTFKSSASIVGANNLSQRCAELETLIREDKLDNLADRIGELCKEIASVQRALQMLQESPS